MAVNAHSVEALIDRSMHRIVATGLAQPGELIPASPADVVELERRFGPLPVAYARFIRRVGGGAGRFLQGTDWHVSDLLRIDRFSGDGEDPPPWQLDEGAMLIASHGGYTGFYLANRDDDPPVMMFREAEAPGSWEAPRLWSDHFTTWLDDMIRSEADGWRKVDAVRKPVRARGFARLRRLFSRDISRP